MPYIMQEARDRLGQPGAFAYTPGELHYQISQLIVRYLKRVGTSYTSLNAVLGVLSACGHELYRRKVAPYEDQKMRLNGDVGYGEGGDR